MTIASLVESLVGSDSPIAVEAFDGSRAGPADAVATLIVMSPDAPRRLATAPGRARARPSTLKTATTRFTRCSRRSRAAAGAASLFALRTNPACGRAPTSYRS